MPNNLLYFPYIQLPDSDWTVRSLLYYETVGAIVPEDFFNNPDGFDPFMLNLIQQELVIPINPLRQLENPAEINKPFLDFVSSENFFSGKILEDFNEQYGLINIAQNYKSTPALIYSQKFDQELIYSLVQLGLAKESKIKNKKICYVENKTANYLMAYLAGILASKLDMLPGTDDEYAYKCLDELTMSGNELNDGKRKIILESLIPMPRSIELKKIRKFKDANFESLNRFVNIIEQIVLNPIYDNDGLFDEKLKQLNFEKDALVAKMKENKFNDIIFGTACGIFGAFQGLATANTTGAVIGGLPGFLSAVYSASKIERPEKIFDQTGMKYLALMDYKLSSSH